MPSDPEVQAAPEAQPAPAAISNRYPVIDGLRALAAWYVFVYHTWQFTGIKTVPLDLGPFHLDLADFMMFGWSGVDLFMILSGLCLFLPIVRSKRNQDRWTPSTFFKRRMVRLLPGYYGSIGYALALPFLAQALFHCFHLKAYMPPFPDAAQFITHALFIHTFFKATWAGIYGPLWSLGVEAQLYIGFPITIYCYHKWGARVFPCIIALSVLYVTAVWVLLNGFNDKTLSFIWSVNLLGRWFEFGAGMLVAWMMTDPAGTRHLQKRLWLGVLTLMSLCILGRLAQVFPAIPWYPSNLLLTGSIYFLLVMQCCCSDGWLRKIVGNPVFAFIGYISYSTYLIHFNTASYFLDLCKQLFKIDGLPLYFLTLTAGYALVLALSYPFFLVFEKPFLGMQFARKRQPEQGGQPDSTAPASH